MMKNLQDFVYPAANPSLLAADKERIEEELLFAEKSGARFIHIDVMDGRFVPNTSFGLSFVQRYHAVHHMVNDTHLMIEEPWLYVEDYVKAGSDIVTFHYEACPDDKTRFLTIEKIHQAGGLAGMSIKPATPVEVLTPFLESLDLVLIMSVEPGKGGQAFLPESLLKLDKLTSLLQKITKKMRPTIEIDGGINDYTFKNAIAHGAQLLVAGSYLFGHEDFALRLHALEQNGEK